MGICRPLLRPRRACSGTGSFMPYRQQCLHWTPGLHLHSVLLLPGILPPPSCSWVKSSVGLSYDHVSSERKCKGLGQNECPFRGGIN